MKVAYLGKSNYRHALNLQHAIFTAKIKRQKERQLAATRSERSPPLIPDIVLVTEHDPPVYTMGKRDTSGGFDPQKQASSGGGKSLIDGRNAALPAMHAGAEVIKIGRGGGITWHGPGQVTMYPICNVQSLWQRTEIPAEIKGRSPVRWFSSVLENTMIAAAGKHGVHAHPGCVGVWVPRSGVVDLSPEKLAQLSSGACTVSGMDSRKLGSIGLQLSDWVSMHGLGFNVSNDLSFFEQVVMCEMPDKSATSLQQLLREAGKECPDVPVVAEDLATAFIAALRLPAVSAGSVEFLNTPSQAWTNEGSDAIARRLKAELAAIAEEQQQHQS